MATTFQLQIVTQQGVRYDGQVESVQAPGVKGYFGVRQGHAAMIAELGIGRITLREGKQRPERVYACSGGILNVSGSGVVVLADAVEEGTDIDVARARQAEERARARLQERAHEVDLGRAEAALSRARNRLKIGHGGL
jgi:F-type H+-transporting ATPase subunit epsilon